MKLSGFMRKPSLAKARGLALEAFKQDATRDRTSEASIPSGMRCHASIIAKSSFILCGIVEADAIFRSRKVSARWKFREGEQVKKGSVVCQLEGKAREILACERTVLNYLSFLSGIATKAGEASRKFGKWKISATRKTLPLLTHSEKRAVLAGGCLTHRLSLSDGILIKDNHISAIIESEGIDSASAVSIAVSKFPKAAFVEVEVSSEREAASAAKAGAKAILIDNATPREFAKIARAARKANPKIIIEASGGIALKDAGKYLKAGADFASTSELTMCIRPADLSLGFSASP